MTPKTIQKLDQLNQDFYTQVAIPFSESRQQAWAGWQQLLPVLSELLTKRSHLRVLDLGCGNGRFGHFLAEHFEPNLITYSGCDSSEALLTIAKQSLSPVFQSLQLTKVNLITELLHSTEKTWFNQEWDVIVCFGVIHHLPSQAIRQALVSRSCHSVSADGVVIIAAWQFLQSSKLASKIVEPELVGLTKAELEPNDYILSWERGTTAWRYCHLVDYQEFRDLLPKEAINVEHYVADGKEGNLNQYFIVSTT